MALLLNIWGVWENKFFYECKNPFYGKVTTYVDKNADKISTMVHSYLLLLFVYTPQNTIVTHFTYNMIYLL